MPEREPHDVKQLLSEFAAAVPRAKRKATEVPSTDMKHTSPQPPTKRQKTSRLSQRGTFTVQSVSQAELGAEPDSKTTPVEPAGVKPISASLNRSISDSSTLEPLQGDQKRDILIIPIYHNEAAGKAIALDESTLALLTALINAEQDHISHKERAEENEKRLEDFRQYAIDEYQQLTRAEWIYGRPPYDITRLNQVRDDQAGLRDKLAAINVERAQMKARVDNAAAVGRACLFGVICPLQEALVKEDLVAGEKDLTTRNSAFERYFAVPAYVDRFRAPTSRNHARSGSGGFQTRRPVDRGNVYGDCQSYVGKHPYGARTPSSGKRPEIVAEYTQPVENYYPGYMRGGQPKDPSKEALDQVVQCKKRLKEAQRAWDKRSRETGADYFLRHKDSQKALQYEDPLEFDARRFQENNTLTRAIATAETRLAGAIAAAHALKVDITTESQTSNFNDPDGDTDPQRRLSGIHYAAIGVRTAHLDEWLGSLPTTVTSLVPLAEVQPQQPELDPWPAHPVGNHDSPSLVDCGRRKDRIEGERQAAEKKRVNTMDEWSGRYPRRKREAFDRWHANRRGGSL